MTALFSLAILLIALIGGAALISLLLPLFRPAAGDSASSARFGSSSYGETNAPVSSYEPDFSFDDATSAFGSLDLLDDTSLTDPCSGPLQHSTFSDVNPASGLPMLGGGGIDIAGNLYGTNDSDGLFTSCDGSGFGPCDDPFA